MSLRIYVPPQAGGKLVSLFASEYNMQNVHSQKIHIILFLFLLALLGNVTFLNYQTYVNSKSQNQTENGAGFTVVNVASPSAQISKSVDSCYPNSCIDLIREATASLSNKSVTSNKTGNIPSVAKEYYIPIGSGEVSVADYVDVTGLSVYIDSTKYGKLKKVTFEASMHIPTGNGIASAQLYNSTDQHPVWFSEVTMSGDTSQPQLLVSSPIVLDSGNKLYKVQMKTSLSYLSILDSARVHIITE